MNQDPLYQGITETIGKHGVIVQGGNMEIVFWLGIAIFVLLAAVVGLLIDR